MGQVTGVSEREAWNPWGPPLCHADVMGSLLLRLGGGGVQAAELAEVGRRLRHPHPHPAGRPLPRAVPGTSVGMPVAAGGWALVQASQSVPSLLALGFVPCETLLLLKLVKPPPTPPSPEVVLLIS